MIDLVKKTKELSFIVSRVNENGVKEYLIHLMYQLQS